MLYWNEDYYYVLGYSDKRERVTAFRIDRMKTPTIMDDDAVPKPEDFDVSAYSNRVFPIFRGEETTVELECDSSLMKSVIKRLGLDVETEELSEDKFRVKVSVELSPTFYAWVFQFCGKICIINPQSAVDRFKNMIQMQI